VPDGACAAEGIQFRATKHLGNKPHALVGGERAAAALGGCDARTFLPAVLQGKEPVVGQHGRVRVSKHGEHTTFMHGFVALRNEGFHGVKVDPLPLVKALSKSSNNFRSPSSVSNRYSTVCACVAMG